MRGEKQEESLKYLEVKNEIKQKILRNNIQGKLPSERDLAKEFGYSYMTIRQAVGELLKDGFVYKISRKGTFVSNPKSRNIRNQNIGFYMYETIIRDGISGPYYSMIFKYIQREVQKHGYQLTYLNRIENIDPGKVDGVIVTAFPEIETQIIELSKFLPVVLIDNEILGTKIPVVLINNFNAIYDMVGYAVKLGHRRIAYVTGQMNSMIGIKRLQGYQVALRELGIAERKEYVFNGDYHFDSGYESANYYFQLDERPTFIICANDDMAIGLIKGLNEKGLRVPDDVSVSGFDNIDMSSRILPAVTTMGVDYQLLARECVDLLIASLQEEITEGFKITIKTKLIERQSTKKM